MDGLNFKSSFDRPFCIPGQSTVHFTVSDLLWVLAFQMENEILELVYLEEFFFAVLLVLG